MNRADVPPGFEDPLATLIGFHRRIERQLAALGRLPARLESCGIDAESSAAAAALVNFFANVLPLHHDDEERDLMPLVNERLLRAAERERFRDLSQRLESDHREMEQSWRQLRRPLEAIAEGVHRRLPAGLAEYFRAIHATHIAAEEAAVHFTAASRLRPEDRELLSRRILARRAVTIRSRG